MTLQVPGSDLRPQAHLVRPPRPPPVSPSDPLPVSHFAVHVDPPTQKFLRPSNLHLRPCLLAWSRLLDPALAQIPPPALSHSLGPESGPPGPTPYRLPPQVPLWPRPPHCGRTRPVSDTPPGGPHLAVRVDNRAQQLPGAPAAVHAHHAQDLQEAHAAQRRRGKDVALRARGDDSH